MPKASSTDYYIEADGVGRFRIARRTMKLEIDIQVSYSVITQGVTPTPFLSTLAEWISTIKALTVDAPEGWDIEGLDPLDDESFTKLNRVYSAIVDKEASFRPKRKEGGEGGGQEEVRVD